MHNNYNYYNLNILFSTLDKTVFRDCAGNRVDSKQAGLTSGLVRDSIYSLLRNITQYLLEVRYLDTAQHLAHMADHYNCEVNDAFIKIKRLSKDYENLSQAFNLVTITIKFLKAKADCTEKQLDNLPQAVGTGIKKGLKIAEPPIFNGSNSKIMLQHWLNQIALFCSVSGIVMDHKKIVTALSRIHSLAADYLKEFYTHVNDGKTLQCTLSLTLIFYLRCLLCPSCKTTFPHSLDKFFLSPFLFTNFF